MRDNIHIAYDGAVDDLAVQINPVRRPAPRLPVRYDPSARSHSGDPILTMTRHLASRTVASQNVGSPWRMSP